MPLLAGSTRPKSSPNWSNWSAITARWPSAPCGPEGRSPHRSCAVGPGTTIRTNCCPPLKVIWLAALQPCGERLKAALPDWLPAYEADHRRLDADVRQALLTANRATLDRLLIPARGPIGRAATRPGSLLRAVIPIRTEWPENAPGYLEMDTVALCGGALDDRHGWMFDAVDVHTTCSVLRGLPNRSEASVSGHMDDWSARLPFPRRGLDSDHGGEFVNHQLVPQIGG